MIIQIMAIMLLTSEAKAGNSYSLLPSWPNENTSPSGPPQVVITGTVTDETGLPMPEVNVIEKGTYNADVTDAKGEFLIKVSSLNAVLQFSFVGYMTKEIKLDGKSVINIQMEPEVSVIEDVVIVGYGTQKKTTISGSVAVVKGVKLQLHLLSTSPMQLQERLPDWWQWVRVENQAKITPHCSSEEEAH